MKKVIATLASATLCAALVPAAAMPPNAQAATKYVQTSGAFYHYETNWVQDFQSKSKYDKKGNQTSYVYSDFENGVKSDTTKTVYTYDKKGRTKTSKSYKNGKLDTKSKYSHTKSSMTIKHYNAKGKYTGKAVTKKTSTKSTWVEYNAKGKVTSKSITTFNKKGVEKSHKSYENGKLSFTVQNTISGGKIVKRVSKSYQNGKVSHTTTAKLSYSGKYTTEESYDENGALNNSQNYYTEKKTGKQVLIWSKSYFEGNLMSNTTYKHTTYTSGKLKGIVKESIGIDDQGNNISKETYTYKAI